MTINFPHKQEVRLQNPPLTEVVCQVRFPAILRILKEDPSDFQELIRSRFPEWEVEQGFMFRFPGSRSAEKPAVEKETKIHRFKTPDKENLISLAADFFALSTKNYTHWHDFVSDLSLAQETVSKVYKPAYATRIGLRYINRFSLKNTKAENFDQVLDLFNPDLTILLRNKAWTEPSEWLSQLVLSDNGAKLTLRSGYGKENGEDFFLLDFDYFEEDKLSLDNLIKHVNQYHDVIYSAFRWSMKDESLALFGMV